MAGGNYEIREIREKGCKKRHRAQYFLGVLGELGVRSFSRKDRKERQVFLTGLGGSVWVCECVGVEEGAR